MSFAGLDIAIGPDGPHVIELNVYPDKQGAAHLDLSHAAFFDQRTG
jgi:glutathione synthase/RimK-type ligase-like ATP-grasp enzyme